MDEQPGPVDEKSGNGASEPVAEPTLTERVHAKIQEFVGELQKQPLEPQGAMVATYINAMLASVRIDAIINVLMEQAVAGGATQAEFDDKFGASLIVALDRMTAMVQAQAHAPRIQVAKQVPRGKRN